MRDLFVYTFETQPFPGFAPGPTQGMVGNTRGSRRETGGIPARRKVGMPLDANPDSPKCRQEFCCDSQVTPDDLTEQSNRYLFFLHLSAHLQH